MQCSCGGSTKIDHFRRVRKVNKKTGELISLPEHLEIDVCEACGRNGRQRLYVLRGQHEEVLMAQRS